MLNKIFEPIITVFRDMIRQMRDGEIRLVASALAFSTLLSLVPFLAVTLSIFKNFGGLESLYPKVESFLLAYLEEGVGTKAILTLQKILQRIDVAQVGLTGGIALLLSSLKLIQDMERGVNRVWNVREPRPFYRRVVVSLTLFVIFPASLAVYLTFRSVGAFKSFFHSDWHNLADVGIVVFGLFLLYRFVPNVRVRNRNAFVSALVACLLLVGLKNSFAWTATKVFTYNRIYGGLASVPLLCLWILGIWYIVLGGLALCASTQKRRWVAENYGFPVPEE